MEMIFLLTGIVIGAASLYFYFRFSEDKLRQQTLLNAKVLESKVAYLENELKKSEADLSAERSRSFDLNAKFTRAHLQVDYLQERLLQQKTELDELQIKFYKEFENLANRILEEKSEKFSRLNRMNLDEILKPLGEKIKDFEKKIEDNTKENIERHSSLKEQIFHLNQLNQQISKEANNLASALKGQVAVQGKWGEIILESILEKSGLVKGREYFVQQSVGQSRPDIIIQLPENKRLIIDAKVSLTAYERFCSETDELTKAKCLKEHITSIRTHVKTLGVKEYQNLYSSGSPDFILLFVPIEPAFTLAVMHDAEIFNEAFENNIVIVSTSTLLATLRTISSIWRQEYQTRNVLQIAQQSGALYDKFVGFLNDMEEIGKKISSTQDCYDQALSKLSTGKGNLINRAESIKKLGAKTSKSIPEMYLDKDD